MELITYDKEKCDGCGFCAAVCICDVQIQKEKKEVPELVHPENCIVCGHCVAVCPNDAIIHHKIDMNNMVPINHAEIDGDNMENFLSSKRSVRHFSNKPVSRDVVEKLIKVACKAPSGDNNQNRTFVVLTDPKKIQKIENAVIVKLREKSSELRREMKQVDATSPVAQALEASIWTLDITANLAERGETPIFRSAPCVIFIYAPQDDWSGQPEARDDCVLAQDYLMLQAYSMGLGTCIIGYAELFPEVVAEYLDIPEGYELYCATILGYPKYKYQKTVERNPAKIVWL